MRHLRSIGLLVIIELNRIFDHAWRMTTGAPTVKRSMITPHVFLGGQYSNIGLKRLHALGVTAIVNMRTTPIPSFPFISTFKTLHLPTPDLQAPKIEDLLKGISFIQQEVQTGGKVYIHCRLGEGRGPTMTIAYLMSTGLTFQDAHTLVKSIRVFVRLTKPQREVLQELEKILFDHKSKNIS